MKRIDRYVIRELLPPFLMGVVVIVVMFQINYFMALGKNDMTRNVPPQAIWKIILLETPGFLNQTLPIAVSLATSLAMSRIARESELTALRAAGTRVIRVVWPTALFGLLAAIANFYVVDKLTPLASKASLELQTNVGVIANIGPFITDVPIKLKQYTVSLGMATKRDENTLDIKEVFLIERPEPTTLTLIFAPRGQYNRGLWKFQDAVTFSYRFGKGDIVQSTSKEMVIDQSVVVSDLFMAPSGKEQGVFELRDKIAQLKKAGQYTRGLEIEYHIKFATPAMCFIFALVSPVFAIMFAKHGGFVGVVISMVVVMIYYNAWIVSTQILGKNPACDPMWAAWLPNIIFLILGLIGLRRLE